MRGDRHEMMKHIRLLLGMAWILAGCTGTATVEKATSQTWQGGAAGSGGGINYMVYVAKPSKLAFVVDRVWLGDREKGWLLDFRVMYKGLANGINNHEAPTGVTACMVEFRETFPGQPNPRGESRPSVVKPFDNPPQDLPATFDKGVAVYYHLGSKADTWVIADFQVLETLNYP
jgi:hypothetical protein